MKYLLREDYVPFAPDTPSQIKMAHQENCDNGTDHTERLYIKRCKDGVIKAYCQNCGARGIHRPDDYIRPVADVLEPLSSSSLITIPRDSIYDAHLWPTKYKAHLFKFDITYDEIEANRLSYSPTMKRIIIPVFDEEDNLVSWQGKSLTKEPKYMGQHIPGTEFALHYATQVQQQQDMNVVVLTEDFISAIRCARHLPSVVVHGVHIKETMVADLIKSHKRVIIFFDDDNETVRDKTREFEQALNMLMDSCVSITGYNKDPKAFNRTDLRGVLYDAYERVV